LLSLHAALPILGHLDELDLVAGQRPTVLVEEGPVRVRPAYDAASAQRERVGDGAEVEGDPQVPGAQGEVLVVEEYGQAFFGVHPATLRACPGCGGGRR